MVFFFAGTLPKEERGVAFKFAVVEEVRVVTNPESGWILELTRRKE